MARTKNINVNTATDVLSGLKNKEREPEPKKENLSLRQLIMELYPKIQELMDDGWSREEICDHLKKEMNLEFSNSTVFSYMVVAKREFEAKKKTVKKTANKTENKETTPVVESKPAETAPKPATAFVVETAPKSGNEYIKQAQQAHTVKTEAQKPNVDMPIFAEDEKN